MSVTATIWGEAEKGGIHHDKGKETNEGGGISAD
jgi:hypothetical protein